MKANIIPFRHPGQERRRLSIFLAALAVLEVTGISVATETGLPEEQQV